MELKEVLCELEKSIGKHITDLRIYDYTPEEIKDKEEIIDRLLFQAKEKRDKLHKIHTVDGFYPHLNSHDKRQINVKALHDLIESI